MRPEPRERFKVLCRELGADIAKQGLRLRIALHQDQKPEAFLLYAIASTKTQTQVYTETKAVSIMNGLLARHGSNADQFLEEAATVGAKLRRATEKREPVVWSDPGLVISGIAPGILERWRRRRDELGKEALDVA